MVSSTQTVVDTNAVYVHTAVCTKSWLVPAYVHCVQLRNRVRELSEQHAVVRGAGGLDLRVVITLIFDDLPCACVRTCQLHTNVWAIHIKERKKERTNERSPNEGTRTYAYAGTNRLREVGGAALEGLRSQPRVDALQLFRCCVQSQPLLQVSHPHLRTDAHVHT